MAALKRLNVAILGAGVVGGGVVEILRQQAPRLAALGLSFNVKTIMCRDPSKPRDFVIDAHTHVTSDAAAIVSDPSLDMVVEVAGGTDPARDVILHAARAGKSVVTANKALLAAHLPEMEGAFPGPRGTARLGFEAAVAGGIPIIRTLQQALATDTFTSVSGILNGTTNYMLTAMAERGVAYADILAEAQGAGYAEADPTADVEGHDARNKIVLLARLAFGVTVPVSAVATVGITGVTPADVALARELGCTVKLVGRAAMAAHGGRVLEIGVRPCLVPSHGLMGTTGGALNVVQCESTFLGSSAYRGPGAGRFPTALSVVADMVNIATGQQAAVPFPRPGVPLGSVAATGDISPVEALVRWGPSLPRGEAGGRWLEAQLHQYAVAHAGQGQQRAGAALVRADALLPSAASVMGVRVTTGSLEGLARELVRLDLPPKDVAVYPILR